MLDTLAQIEARYDKLNELISDPEVLGGDQQQLVQYTREQRSLEEVVRLYRELKKVLEELEGAQALGSDHRDPDLAELAREEARSLEAREAELRERLRLALVPRDPNDDKDVIVEVRAGAGGDEAALFAFDLYRMYVRWAEQHGYKVEVLSQSESDLEGVKEVVFAVKGKGAWSRLKYEAGVHRVQRVPVTESQGRIHTSAAGVNVLPEADPV